MRQISLDAVLLVHVFIPQIIGMDEIADLDGIGARRKMEAREAAKSHDRIHVAGRRGGRLGAVPWQGVPAVKVNDSTGDADLYGPAQMGVFDLGFGGRDSVRGTVDTIQAITPD